MENSFLLWQKFQWSQHSFANMSEGLRNGLFITDNILSGPDAEEKAKYYIREQIWVVMENLTRVYNANVKSNYLRFRRAEKDYAGYLADSEKLHRNYLRSFKSLLEVQNQYN